MRRLLERFDDVGIRWKLLGAFGLVLLFVVAQSAFVYRSTSQSHDADDWVSHTFSVIDRIDDASNELLGMQASYRGFLLTGDEAYLAPYTAGVGDFATTLARLRAETTDNPEQQARWDALVGQVGAWQRDITEPGIALRRSVNAGNATVEQVQEFARTSGGEAQFNAIRQVLDDAVGTERALLAVRSLRAEEARNRLRLVTIGGTTLIAGLAIGLALAAASGIAGAWQRLAAAAGRIAGGDLQTRVGLARRDEIGQSAAAFDRMAERLQRTVAQLEGAVTDAKRSEARGRAVLDAAREGIVLVAADGEVLSANRRFVELVGTTFDRIIGRSVYDLREPLARIFADPGVLDRFLPTITGSDATVTEIVRQVFPVERELELTSVPAVGPHEERVARAFAFRDVTAEREVDRMKTEFVSLVSHELRTPLTSIKGYVELLLDGEAGELAGDQAEFLEVVRANVDRLVGLINDLLDISRIEAGKVELRPVPVELAPLVQTVARSFAPQFEDKRQTLSIRLPSTLPPVLADPDRLIQILTNLLSNAHKYTPAGGSAEVRVAPHGDAVRIAVADTGIGMTPEEQGMLFTKFFRARNRTTQEVGGTGLGLVITRSLVQMHGGDLEVTSAPGDGTTFAFTLPAVESAAPPVEPAGAPVSRSRVLVVDAAGDTAALIRRHLEQMGHEVIVAGTGAAAIDAARKHLPDAITLGPALPDMDGRAVLAALRRDPATAGIPVVVVSIQSEDGSGGGAAESSHVTKPVDETSLIDRIEEALASRRAGGVAP